LEEPISSERAWFDTRTFLALAGEWLWPKRGGVPKWGAAGFRRASLAGPSFKMPAASLANDQESKTMTYGTTSGLASLANRTTVSDDSPSPDSPLSSKTSGAEPSPYRRYLLADPKFKKRLDERRSEIAASFRRQRDLLLRVEPALRRGDRALARRIIEEAMKGGEVNEEEGRRVLLLIHARKGRTPEAPCRISRSDAWRVACSLERALSRGTTRSPPQSPLGRAPRAATNSRSKGSNRTSSSSGDSPSGLPGESDDPPPPEGPLPPGDLCPHPKCSNPIVGRSDKKTCGADRCRRWYSREQQKIKAAQEHFPGDAKGCKCGSEPGEKARDAEGLSRAVEIDPEGDLLCVKCGRMATRKTGAEQWQIVTTAARCGSPGLHAKDLIPFERCKPFITDFGPHSSWHWETWTPPDRPKPKKVKAKRRITRTAEPDDGAQDATPQSREPDLAEVIHARLGFVTDGRTPPEELAGQRPTRPETKREDALTVSLEVPIADDAEVIEAVRHEPEFQQRVAA
jgi:hypothetical protein